VVVIVIIGIVLHPRFVVIGKCMAYKLSLHYFNIVCKSQKRRVELANRQYSNNIHFKKDKKAFSFAELHSQMFKALIKSKYHEIICINYTTYISCNFLCGSQESRLHH
jgi:hypothetical protein